MAHIDRETRKRLAAYLYAVEHLTEDEIKVRLGGISQSTVAKILREAKEEGVYEQSAVYRGKALSGEDMELLHALQFQSDLHAKIAARLAALAPESGPAVYLYDLRAQGGGGVPIEARVRAFAAEAAPELRRLLGRPKVRNIGVSWGFMIAAMVEAMGRPSVPPRKRDPVTVLAMCGLPLDDRSTLDSSSAIAENLSEALNGTRKEARTLGITPAYLPALSHVEGAEWVWRYIGSAWPYVEVFGTDRLPPGTRARVEPPAEPLADRMDAFLTSVSIEGGTLGYGSNKLYPADVIDPAELEKAVYGDRGGIPLPLPNLDVKQRDMLQRLGESWTGVTDGHLKRCKAKAATGGHPASRVPGCILVAVGAGKARNVYQAVVEEQLVNHLFIDYACAEALDRLLDG